MATSIRQICQKHNYVEYSHEECIKCFKEKFPDRATVWQELYRWAERHWQLCIWLSIFCAFFLAVVKFG